MLYICIAQSPGKSSCTTAGCSLTVWEIVRPSGEGCAVAWQYSSAVSRPAQSSDDITQLNLSLTAIMFTFEAAGILSVEGL